MEVSNFNCFIQCLGEVTFGVFVILLKCYFYHEVPKNYKFYISLKRKGEEET